ncbi:MAG: cell division protein FtsA [Candidatus Omnitrophica bacterium]|nr:cell division protein FtsA [Candidatus Omnitrophota bacterium]
MASRLITGFDLGATKLCATQARIEKDGRLVILGSTAIPCRALVRGTIHQLDLLVEGIRRLILQLEEKTGQRSYAVVLNVSGDHLSLQQSQNGIFLSERGVEISQKDISRVTEPAQQISLPFDHQILHVFPLGYNVDGREGIRDPSGIYGSQLGVRVLIVKGAGNPIQSIAKAVYQAGLAVEDIAYAGLVLGYSVLTEQERELGVVLVDIGGDLTDVSIFFEGNLIHAQTLPFGGRDLTELVASRLAISLDRAEELRKVYGGMPQHIAHADEVIRIRLQGGIQEFSRREFCQILQPRVEQVLNQIQEIIQRSGYGTKLVCGLKMSGGVALTEGFIEYAEQFFGATVKLGLVQGEFSQENLPGGLFCAQSVGLVRYWANEYKRRRSHQREQRNLIARASSWARTLYQEYF